MSTVQQPAIDSATDLTDVTVDETLAALHVHAEVGLTSAEVEARRRQYGYNEVPHEPGHPIRDFLQKFWGLSAWMLELILLLSWVLHKYTDLIVVSALLVINAILGFVQERRAASVVDALRQRLHVRARVQRQGVWQLVPARELVPGDIVRVRQGDVSPADVKVITGALAVDQSALTGESLAVDKGPGDLLYAGSVVRHGESTGVVLLTGGHTYFGRTTELVQLARPQLHIEAVVARVVRWLFVIVGALLSIVSVVALLRGFPFAELLPLLLVLLLSAVPVALPVMFTVSMAVGAKELAKQGVLVTRLSAAEDAALMDVLCVDKTGTITVNQLSITDVVPLPGFTAHDVLFYGALASREANQDPIDLAFLAAARQQPGLEPTAAITPIAFTPFDPQTRRTEAVVEQEGQRLRVMKGAVAAVAQACALDATARAALDVCTREQAQHGYRTLAVARGTEDAPLTLVGLVTLYDPPRPDAQTLIATLRDLGVAVKMLTGDALPVARAIAQRVGLTTVRRVTDIAGHTDSGAVAAEEIDGFAEVYPEDKYTIVKGLQAAGHVVGMTGDGVNDAPALRQAEVGIAVRSATDVAKSAASVVLTEEGLAHIVHLVEQGRIIYQRILTWIINK
jgi:plasma-membrane proton-efflux P-type ATPase